MIRRNRFLESDRLLSAWFANALLVAILFPRLSVIHSRADDLPPGVPHVVDTNGNTFYVDPSFTTEAFQDEGVRLVLEEANRKGVGAD